jgi:hypothetical protein
MVAGTLVAGVEGLVAVEVDIVAGCIADVAGVEEDPGCAGSCRPKKCKAP